MRCQVVRKRPLPTMQSELGLILRNRCAFCEGNVDERILNVLKMAIGNLIRHCILEDASKESGGLCEIY